jgi:hypothetical protein
MPGAVSMRAFLVLTAVAIVGCASTPLEAIVTEQTLVGWKVGSQHDNGRGRGTIVELIPTSESIGNWQHLGTIQFMEGEHRAPRAFMDALETSMRARCPTSTDWRVIGEEPHSILYEWRIHSCAGQDDQTEISRILRGNDGLHRIAYTEKGDTMKPENREFWMGALKKAYVAKGDVSRPIVLTTQ